MNRLTGGAFLVNTDACDVTVHPILGQPFADIGDKYQNDDVEALNFVVIDPIVDFYTMIYKLRNNNNNNNRNR